MSILNGESMCVAYWVGRNAETGDEKVRKCWGHFMPLVAGRWVCGVICCVAKHVICSIQEVIVISHGHN